MKKLVTKEGKLFGVINIIDLLVVLFIVAAVVVVKMFVSGGIGGDDSKLDYEGPFTGADGAIDVVFYAEEVSDFVLEQVDDIDTYVYDDACQHVLGKVTSVDVGESVVYGLTADGEYVKGAKEDYSSVYISATVPSATKTRFGFTYNVANYGVGHSFVIRVDDAKIYVRVQDIRATQRRMRRPVTESNEKYMEMFEV